MMLLGIIVLAVILILLLFRPRRRQGPGLGDSAPTGSVLTGRDDSFMMADDNRFEPRGGDFGGAGASGGWDSDDDDDGDDGDGGDD